MGKYFGRSVYWWKICYFSVTIHLRTNIKLNRPLKVLVRTLLQLLIIGTFIFSMDIFEQCALFMMLSGSLVKVKFSRQIFRLDSTLNAVRKNYLS